MSHALAALQQRADTAAESFCRRSGQPPARRRGKAVRHSRPDDPPPHPRPKIGGFYRPRDHEASPFFKIVREHFDEFERVYPQRYQERYGFWRPVIHSSIDKFLIRYYGFYSNKKRGMREKDNKPDTAPGQPEPDTPFRRKPALSLAEGCRITWAALIKAVYEVDPLKCPKHVVSLPNHAGAR